MTIKIEKQDVIDCHEWDRAVKEIYNRPYCFQQQNGCKHRGATYIYASPDECEDFENDAVPEVINHHKMGVSFKAWLARDPKQPLQEGEKHRTDDWSIALWWKRNFYPSVDAVAHDLCKRGILPEGEYTILID